MLETSIPLLASYLQLLWCKFRQAFPTSESRLHQALELQLPAPYTHRSLARCSPSCRREGMLVPQALRDRSSLQRMCRPVSAAEPHLLLPAAASVRPRHSLLPWLPLPLQSGLEASVSAEAPAAGPLQATSLQALQRMKRAPLLQAAFQLRRLLRLAGVQLLQAWYRPIASAALQSQLCWSPLSPAAVILHLQLLSLLRLIETHPLLGRQPLAPLRLSALAASHTGLPV